MASGTGVGAVVIGRNEGERLRRCLASLAGKGSPLIYVDSGSSDGSLELAVSFGAEVVRLDPGQAFTAARARNEGFAQLRRLAPALEYVQFVDGDCELVADWLGQAKAFLDQHPQVAVVCGRRRERQPEASIYNRLCDWEWDTPVGEAKACGGDALMRVSAIATVGGYRAGLIAGEEPELCLRLRRQGWRIWRLGAEMTLHDAAMTGFGQWWRRSLRAGHAFAEGAWLHGRGPEHHWVRDSLSALVWSLGLPLGASLLALGVGPAAWWLLSIYPLQLLRLTIKGRHMGMNGFWRALFLLLGKFAEASGIMRFLLLRLVAGRSGLIEYKS